MCCVTAPASSSTATSIPAAIIARMHFRELHEQVQRTVSGYLHAFVARHVSEPRLAAACQHLLGRGKLVRPAAVAAAATAFNPEVSSDRYLHTAAAVELVHTFTLIHDDLPEMDDAKMRRGVRAVHLEHGHDMALLAGDALFNLALMALVEDDSLNPPEREDILREFTHSINSVIEGQAKELTLAPDRAAVEEVEEVERMKTGHLFACALVCGAVIGGADFAGRAACEKLGLLLGQAFQIRDDLLAVTADNETAGKSLEQDEVLDRPTILRLLGVEGARRRFGELCEQVNLAIGSLKAPRVDLLQGLADDLREREK
jgi:geranylgeranyl pyrophosphate synthase